MADVSDRWYVRFPDGRVIRAKSTKSLRYHLGSGRIPAEARVRRSPAEEWTALQWTAEFVDIVSPGSAPADTAAPPEAGRTSIRAATPSSNVEEMKVLGLRGMVGDLVSALES